MKDEDKTKEQLILEVIELRKQVSNLKVLETMRKQYEETLKISESNYRIILENTHEPIYIAQNGMLKYVNAKTKQISGYSEDELTSRPFIDFIHPDDREFVMSRHIKRLKGENPTSFYQYRLIDKYGNIKWMELKVIRIIWDGKPATLNFINDITEQKQTQEALRLSEERFFKAFYYSPVAMTIHYLDNGKFINTNEVNLKIHGYSAVEFLGRTALDLNLWVDTDECGKYQKEMKEKGLVYNHEIKSRKKSGEIFIALMSGVVINLNGEQCVLTIKSDITELRQYQKEILRLDRLNLIGEMAAGIAHEVRNPMTTVRGFLQILGQKGRYHQDKEHFDLMIEELDRANSIITDFLSLTKNKIVDLKVQNLNNILNSLFPLIQADAMVFGKYVILELNEIPELLLDEKEIRQLVLNLSRNGLEALPSGEYMTIKTYLDGNEVVLSVEDQGKGIPVDIIDKIGNPFFTTKDNGTGLGLATCYSIAVRHNASINFDTGPEGTTFYVRFKVST